MKRAASYIYRKFFPVNPLPKRRLKLAIIKEELIRTYDRIIKKFPNKKIYFLSDINLSPKFCNKIESLKDINVKDNIFICYYENDEELTMNLRNIKEHGGVYFSLLIPNPIAEYMHENIKCTHALMKSVDDIKNNENKLTRSMFDRKDFQNIMQAIEITRNVEGDYVEIGTFLGSSGISALNYMNIANIDKMAYFIDTYQGFDYEEAQNSSDLVFDKTHFVWEAKKHMEYIKKLFKKTNHPFKLIKANICKEDLSKITKKIAVCNIDVDLYDAVLDGLKKAAPLMSKNGIMISEDFGHTPALGGANLAVREFLESKEGKRFIPIYMESGQIFLIKK